MKENEVNMMKRCLDAHIGCTAIHTLQEVESNEGFITNECNMHAQVNAIQP